jgi:hypothetical protein
MPQFVHARVSTGTKERANRQAEHRAGRALTDIPIGQLQSLHDRGHSIAHYRPLAPCARSTVVHDYEHLQYLRFEALQQHTTRKYIKHYGVVVNRT